MQFDVEQANGTGGLRPLARLSLDEVIPTGDRRLIRPNAALHARGEVVAGLAHRLPSACLPAQPPGPPRGGASGDSNLRLLGESDAVSWRNAVPTILSRDRTWAIDRRGGGGCLISSEGQFATLLSLSGASGVRAGCPAWGDAVAESLVANRSSAVGVPQSRQLLTNTTVERWDTRDDFRSPPRPRSPTRRRSEAEHIGVFPP